MRRRILSALCGLAVVGCGGEEEPAASTPFAEHRLDRQALERGRRDSTWKPWADQDRAARSGTVDPDGPREAPGAAAPGAVRLAESFQDITPGAVNHPPPLPIPREGGGPSALHVQVLLDRVHFSPGVLDGYWGKNTEKAVYWFQHAEGLDPTGHVDEATYARLHSLTAEWQPVMLYGLTAEDVAGPFVSLPEDVYDKAELDCLCYETVLELLAERFHTTPEVLAQLNPGLDPDGFEEGSTLWVPNVANSTGEGPGIGRVARIVISTQGFYTQALDAEGRILLHFPSTLGAGYDPSPTGDFRVAAVTFDPWFHYQPDLFHEVPDHEPTAMLPPGPNSPVGVVWIALSKDHYGIHGTSSPASIGYTSSHGCVRLTNWDARRLAHHVDRGTPVEFR